MLMKEKEIRNNLIKDLGIFRTKSRIFQLAYKIGAIEKKQFFDKYNNIVEQIFLDYNKIKDYYQKRIEDNKNIEEKDNVYFSIAQISKKFKIKKNTVYYLIKKFKFFDTKKDNYYSRVLINEQEFRQFYLEFKKNFYKRKYKD